MMVGWILMVIFFGSGNLHFERFTDKGACEQAAMQIRSWRAEAERASTEGTALMFVGCMPNGQGVYPMRGD